MYQFEPVYYDLTLKYKNKLNDIKKNNKINIVKITNNEIFTNFEKNTSYQCLLLIFIFIFILFHFFFFNC